jgi:DNA modification methylase
MNDLYSDQESGSGPVECLGLKFPSDRERREHFLKLLAEKLKDPSFRKQEGFPKGTDEAILAMSDPPYYTACPNPWVAEFVEHYGKPYDPTEKYSREPLAIDVSIGKTDPIYKAHSYYTKVPHLAIVPSILHYTKPGDLVLDGFAGSGMTGVAAQWCGCAPATYQHELEQAWRKEGRPAPQWGARRVVLNELAPAATFISANYNFTASTSELAARVKAVVKAIERETAWMYETKHTDGISVGAINYMVWSEVFTCPECAGKIVFTDAALDEGDDEVAKVFHCAHCDAELTKKRLDRVFEEFADSLTGTSVRRTKFVPVLINYKVGRAVFEKSPDEADLALLGRIERTPLPGSLVAAKFPIDAMYHGSRLRPKGYEWVHQLYTRRALISLGLLKELVRAVGDRAIQRVLLALVYHQTVNASLRNSYRPGSNFGNRAITGVYYVSSMPAEANVASLVGGTAKKLIKLADTVWSRFEPKNAIVSTGSATRLASVPSDSIDYVFTDPPFGSNIFYADLNVAYESWLGVYSNPSSEAIIDPFKAKELIEYRSLMRQSFAEYFRVLKPGRWMTVVFSNSKAAVWNAIQVALQEAGFVVAEVSALDKVQGSFRQVTSTTAVKQDLVISAYKPNGGLEQRLVQRGATPESAWDFVHTHLGQLSVTKVKDGALEFIVERDPRRIYDRLVAWFVRHDSPVPLSSDEFLIGLRSRFPERDGMVFLSEQVGAYDRKRAQVAQAPQMELFVSDERSAIDWLADFLKSRPSTYQELNPEFVTQLGAGWKKHEAKPELAALLENNFLKYDGSGDVPSQIHSYLSTNYRDLRGLGKGDPTLTAKAQGRWYVPDPNKAIDLEKKREKALLKEFENYRAATGRKLKEFRLEALRAGFKAAWAARDYKTIIAIAQKIPDEALQEDEKLLLWYDQAVTRAEASA